MGGLVIIAVAPSLSVVRRKVSSQRCPFLIPRICEYVTLHSQRGFANVIKLRTLQLGRLSQLAQYNHKGPYKREARGSESEEEICMTTEAEFGVCAVS